MPLSREPGAPEWRHYWLFFLGVPCAMAFLFSLVGIRLINGMPYLDGLLYMVLHMCLAWWNVSLGSWAIHYMFRSWQPPVMAIIPMGFIISAIPAAFSFQALGDLYASLYPVFAANRADTIRPGWSIDYLGHFIRYSIPALPLYIAGVYGYRAVFGVEWLTYPSEARQDDVPARQLSRNRPLASMIDGSKLDGDAEIIAIKAEQHYIRIWSDRGTDMVRYRFRDVAETLAGCDGDQVHRSWWVNFGRVSSVRPAGRSVELELPGDLSVPVSLAHRNTVLRELNHDS